MKLVRILSAAALASVVAVSAAPASAVTVDFANVTGTWLSVVGQTANSNVSFAGNATANAAVRWGQGANRSGYDFNTIGIPQLTLTPPGNSAVTKIASFTHVNQPITANTSITSAKLRFTTDVIVDGSFLSRISFLYDFTHNETPNAANPCAVGGANNVGVNINGCADQVTNNFNANSQFFNIGGTDYTLDVVGFLVGTPETEATSFLTVEREINSAFILGRIVPFAAAVPESSTWIMMITGFGLIGGALRQQRRTAAA